MAAFNHGYPATYQQMYPFNPFAPQMMQQPVQQPTGRMVEVVPVESEDAADSTTTPSSAGTRLEAFYAAFAALSPAERKTAAKWIARNAVAGCIVKP